MFMDFISNVLIISSLIIGSMTITLFIRRLLVNIQLKNNTTYEMNKKLDRIIDLLERRT